MNRVSSSQKSIPSKLRSPFRIPARLIRANLVRKRCMRRSCRNSELVVWIKVGVIVVVAVCKAIIREPTRRSSMVPEVQWANSVWYWRNSKLQKRISVKAKKMRKVLIVMIVRITTMIRRNGMVVCMAVDRLLRSTIIVKRKVGTTDSERITRFQAIKSISINSCRIRI